MFRITETFSRKGRGCIIPVAALSTTWPTNEGSEVTAWIHPSSYPIYCDSPAIICVLLLFSCMSYAINIFLIFRTRECFHINQVPCELSKVYNSQQRLAILAKYKLNCNINYMPENIPEDSKALRSWEIKRIMYYIL